MSVDRSRDPAARAYRQLLGLYPREFRVEYGAAMEETFALRRAEAARRGRVAVLRLFMREVAGTARAAFAERRRERRRERREAGDPSGGAGGGPGIEAALRELRYAARRLVRSPGFTLATVLTLGLALGANGALFTLVRRIVLNPLPYPSSDRLIELNHGAPGLNVPSGLGMSPGLYLQYAETRSLASLAMYNSQAMPVSGDGAPENVVVTRATVSLLDVLRVSPALGRWFAPEHGLPRSGCRVVLSHGFWMRRYGGDPGVPGRTIQLDGGTCEILGVMPASFAFPGPQTEMWTALPLEPVVEQPGGFNFIGVARLRDGYDLDDVRAELNGIIARLPQVYSNAALLVDEARLTSLARTLLESETGGVARSLWILLGAAGLVLVIACANVANLLLVRSEARQRELAVRRALGAGRRGLFAFTVSESVLLAAAGAVLGTALAYGAVRVLVRLSPPSLPRLHEIRLDAHVLGFLLALTVVSAVFFALLPLMRRDSAGLLQDRGRGNSASRARLRLRHTLMGVQVALAVVLLIGSGLMLRSFQQMRRVDPGFDPRGTLLFDISLPTSQFPASDEERRRNRQAELLSRIAAIPGVQSVSAATCLALRGYCYGDLIEVEGAPAEARQSPRVVVYRLVAPDWFETARFHVRRGRTLTAADFAPGVNSVVASQSLAEVYFPGEDPIGRRITTNIDDSDPTWHTIVGIVADVPTTSLTEKTPIPALYFPWIAPIGPSVGKLTYTVRTAGPPLALVEPIRAAVNTIAPDLPLDNVGTAEDLLAKAGVQLAFTMMLLVCAGTVAFALGLVGTYGVIAYTVSQRTAEIGIRLALGATPTGIHSLVLRQGGLVIGAGLLAGLGVALGVARVMQSLLFRVAAVDALTYGAVLLLVMTVSLAACWLPARRAARLDPARALRAD